MSYNNVVVDAVEFAQNQLGFLAEESSIRQQRGGKEDRFAVEVTRQEFPEGDWTREVEDLSGDLAHFVSQVETKGVEMTTASQKDDLFRLYFKEVAEDDEPEENTEGDDDMTENIEDDDEPEILKTARSFAESLTNSVAVRMQKNQNSDTGIAVEIDSGKTREGYISPNNPEGLELDDDELQFLQKFRSDSKLTFTSMSDQDGKTVAYFKK